MAGTLFVIICSVIVYIANDEHVKKHIDPIITIENVTKYVDPIISIVSGLILLVLSYPYSEYDTSFIFVFCFQ